MKLQDLLFVKEKMVIAAIKASRLITEFKKDTLKVKVKVKDTGSSKASTVVTQADLLSQGLILKELEPVFDRYAIDIIAEEDSDNYQLLNKDYLMLVDPLDGTLPFIENTAGYAVSLALIDKSGDSLIGVVSDIVSENIYSAVKGEGALKNNNPIVINKSTERLKLNVYLDRSSKEQPLYKEAISTIFNQYSSIKLKEVDINTDYGAVINACSVLENSRSVYFKLPKKEKGGGAIWDFAATNCIFKESGGWVSDFYGNSLKLYPLNRSLYMNESGIIYSNDNEIARNIIKFYNEIKV